jgi:crotonobetainyl-CoA:carnitine CoA-transferase CaiB-like acyl-CoA transferase
LEGVTVLDLSTIYAGPYGGMLCPTSVPTSLKVEPLDGDPWRAFAFGFLGANRGKRGLALNLKHEEGLALFYDLVRRTSWSRTSGRDWPDGSRSTTRRSPRSIRASLPISGFGHRDRGDVAST